MTFELSRNILLWYSKSYFDIRTESENRILKFEILFWHSIWVGKSYFDIRIPILTFEMSRKRLFWHKKSYFDNRTETENRIFTLEICFDIRTASEIEFWHSKSYFDIRPKSENAILIFKILLWHSNLFWKCYFDIRTEW